MRFGILLCVASLVCVCSGACSSIGSVPPSRLALGAVVLEQYARCTATAIAQWQAGQAALATPVVVAAPGTPAAVQ